MENCTTARARGILVLKASTVKSMRDGGPGRDDPFQAAEIAGTLAVKRTHDLLPHHPHTHIGRVEFDFYVDGNRVIVECEVTVHDGRAEMCALTGVTVALLTLWDAVKGQEEEDGRYTMTQINSVEIVKTD